MKAPGVAATVVQQGNAVLLLRRGSTAPWMPGKWNFPTGHIEEGETAPQAARREVLEESGLTVHAVRPVLTLELPTNTVAYFHTTQFSGGPKINWESSEWRWVPIDEVASFDCIPGVNRALAASQVPDTSHGHYTELCSGCGDVISQCRCGSPNKETQFGLCEKCGGEPFQPMTFEDLAMFASMPQRVAARYKNKKKVKTQDGDEMTVYEYSDKQIAHRNREKAKRIEQLSKDIASLRKQVFKDLASEDVPTALKALAVGLMDETYERVGNPQSAKDGHFGVTGWRKKHISFGKGKATIKYVGKSGVEQTKTVSDPALLKALRKAYDGAEKEDIFGSVGASEVNAYLKEFGVTAKDIRGFHANDVMRGQLQSVRKGKLPSDPKEREKVLKAEFKKALEATAAAVGHEPSTLRSQYLVPGLEDSYVKDGTIAKKLDKAAEKIALTPQQKGWERRKERDERAQYNIPSEYHGLWNKLKNQFKGTPDQRAEQFMEYVEEHPYENDAWLQEHAGREIAKMERERQKQMRLEQKCETGQDKYEDAWYKEQERQTKEKQRLKQLKERADDACQSCPTCNVTPAEDYEPLPFAASVHRVAARYSAEMVRIDEPWVDKMRKDFLTLMKNVPRVKDYDTAIRLKEAFNIWRKRAEDLFFEKFLNKSLKYDQRIKETVRQTLDHKLRSPAGDFFFEADLPIDRATDYWPAAIRFSRYQEDVKKWEARVKRKAQVFWKALREAIDYYEDPGNRVRFKEPDEPPTLEAEMPSRDKLVLEGFQVEIRGYKSGDEYHAEELSMLREALRRYRKRAAERMPWLLKNQLPMILEFEATLDTAGRYNHDGTITVYASATIRSTPDKIVKTLAHEMGHHLWGLIGSGAQDYWSTAIHGDYGDLDVRELLSKWPGSMWSYEFADHLADKDPILSLQLDAIWPGYAGRRELAKKEDFEDLLEEGITTMPVPKNPITGYANKNSEEAFCEAVGMMVAYGSRTVLPQIRKWLDVVIPGQLKAARVVARYLEATHSKSKCMHTGCDAKPTVSYLWCEGRARAWFCNKHGEAWAKEHADDIDKTTPVEGGEVKTAVLKPPSKSQLDYAKHLIKQVGGEEPNWDEMSGVEVSNLIDGLKKKRGKPTWYGNGKFRGWE